MTADRLRTTFNEDAERYQRARRVLALYSNVEVVTAAFESWPLSPSARSAPPA